MKKQFAKILSFILAVMMCLSVIALVACGGTDEPE